MFVRRNISSLANVYASQRALDCRSIGDNFHCLSGSRMRTRKRICCSLIKEITFSCIEDTGEIGQCAGIILGWHIRGLWDAESTLDKDICRFRTVKPFWRPELRTVA